MTKPSKLFYTKATLWLLFFIGCFAVGFIQARWSDPVETFIHKTKLNILIHPDVFWTEQDTKYFIHQTGYDLHVEILEKASGLEEKLLNEQNPIDVVILPQHWIPSLIEKGAIQAVPEALKNEFEPLLSADFLVKNNQDELFSLPIFWGITEWVQPPTGIPSLKSGSYYFLEDPGFIQKFQTMYNLSPAKIKTYSFAKLNQASMEMKDWLLLQKQEDPFAIFEIPELEDRPEGWKRVEPSPQSLKIYSLVLSLKTKQINPLKEFLKVLYNLSWQESYLKQHPWASTLKDDQQDSWPAKKKSSALRYQNLQKLIWLKDNK